MRPCHASSRPFPLKFDKNPMNRTPLRLSTRIVLFACLLGLLGACQPTKKNRPPPPSAVELATSQLGSGGYGVNPLETVDELPPETPPPPRREINRRGGLPAIPGARAAMPPMPQVQPADDIVVLDYEQVELRQVLEEIADTLGIALVIDSSIADKVTVRTAEGNPLKHQDLWPLLQLLMHDAGVMMERQGNVYFVKKMPQPVPPDIGDMATAGRSTAPEVLQITPLRYITVDAAAQAIKPLLDPKGRLISLPTLNVMGIVTAPPRLQRINQLLQLLDADPFVHRGMRLYRLGNAKAQEVQGDLDKILKAVEGAKPAYQLIALERVNALLVIAPPNRGFDQVSQWIELLDEENEEGGEQVFIYRVRNLKATTLASTLSEVFKEEEKDDLPKQNKNEPKTDPAQPDNAPPDPATPTPPTSGKLRVSAELKVSIVADEDTNSLLVRARPRDYRQLLETISVLDQVPKEVMINAVIAEVRLTESTKFGIDWGYFFGSKGFLGTNFGVGGSSVLSPNHADAVYDQFNFGDSMTGLVLRNASNSLTGILNLVASDSEVQLLSRPSILVRNNQEATMNVGGDEPTITRVNTTSTTTVNSNFTSSNEVQYRQTGITLKVTPHINDDGIINLDIYQEISNRGEDRTVQQLPSFIQRKIETSVVVRDGNPIVLGGLIDTREDDSQSGIPYLMNAPVLGRAFSNTSQGLTRVELVVIIVPQIVNPQADNRAFVKAFNQRMARVNALLNENYLPLLVDIQDPQPAQEPTHERSDEDAE